ncbi:MAG: amino acid ABC transporter substrate-binding protein [Actinobacteria bacterium]|nr:MAG: amino acid ABC transporter substrate-binding protein [Actinomycetota bacterium]
MRKLLLLVLVGVVAAVAAIVGYSSSANATSAAATPLPSSACGPVFYKGKGKPQFLIASDLPLQGAGRAQNIDMQKAIQYVLDKQYHFKVGKYTVGYQGCDDSTAETGGWDAGKCTSNGRAYASNTSVMGVLGTFNSGCAKLIVPLANRAPGGPLGMLSVANTNVGLTHNAPWNNPGEPGIYYPTGKRNYVRVAASDDYQGPAAADLLLSKAFKLSQGKKFAPIKDVYVLHDNQTFGKGVAEAFRIRAQSLGIKVLGFEPWDAKATSYEAIANRIKGTNADAVYLGGIVCNNGAKLLKDLRAVLGSGPVFVGPDGWTPYSATLAAGSAAQSMYVSYAGQPLEKLPPTGKKFIKAFKKYLGSKTLPPPYAVYQAQGAQIMLAAIKRSNGTRASVTAQLFKTKVKNGIMGTFHFDKNGDIAPLKWISFDQLRGNSGVPVFAVLRKVKS